MYFARRREAAEMQRLGEDWVGCGLRDDAWGIRADQVAIRCFKYCQIEAQRQVGRSTLDRPLAMWKVSKNA
jgi:hypothetical protein